MKYVICLCLIFLVSTSPITVKTAYAQAKNKVVVVPLFGEEILDRVSKRTYTFDISNISGASFDTDIPELTQAVIDDALISTYVTNRNLSYPIPGAGPNAEYVVRVFFGVGFMRVRFYNWDGSIFTLPSGALNELKVVVIESN